MYSAGVVKQFLDLSWLTAVCVSISLRPVAELQCPSLHMTRLRTKVALPLPWLGAVQSMGFSITIL